MNELEKPQDTSFEVQLDEDPELPQHAPVYVDVVSKDHTRRPIVAAQWRGLSNIKGTLSDAGKEVAHHAGFHGIRLPFVYLPLTLFWAPVGAGKLAVRWASWALDWHAWRLQLEATNLSLRESVEAYLKIDEKRARHVRPRLIGTMCCVTVVVLGLTAVYIFAPIYLYALFAAVPWLAHVGRPRAKPILRSAVVVNPVRKLNSDIVLRAYWAAGLGHPDKPDQKVEFLSQLARDNRNKGSQCTVAVHSKTFAEVLKAKAMIASGLDVSTNQIFITKVKASERRHKLYIADVDPLALPAGKTPLLDCKVRDIWQPAPFGLDERGNKVTVPLLWISILIGAMPRKGKTFSARLLALYAALDPYVQLIIVDGKMSADWDKFRLVAYRYVCGVVANSRDDDPITHLLEALRDTKRHIQQVNDFLSKLPTSQCPEGKLTRELSRKYPNLRVRLLVMEEFQNYFETEDQEINKEIAGLLSFIKAVGPSAGVTILSSSQKPSGIGAGDVARLFNRYRDNHDVRFALKCGNRIVSEAVMGGDAYAEGFDAAALPVGPEYLGVGYLYGLTDETPTVRTYLADHPDAEKILIAARRHREAAGTLDGFAAGEDLSRLIRNVLADVRGVFYAGEAWISWAQLASRMSEQMPEHYADLSQDAISAQVRSLGAKPKKGREGAATLWGVPLDEVEKAAERREIAGAR